ncbi:serine/threonine protein kinase [Streptomyces sp. NPDC048516]|uniref:serine/threonine protein kinase n=1 Tax=Streptomyces sp. NPDC048516 TaxID=3365565 RepID=UPI00371479DA
MEPLRPDDPRRIGAYDVVARFDTETSSRLPVPERRFLARLPGGSRTVLISMPLPGADVGRFAVEAEGARRRLSGAWIASVTEVGGRADAPWYATPYLPALTLTGALAAHRGPLPERTVRALGAALAETLIATHASGVTHGGLLPAAVLLAADGPRLTCFGAIRAAAPDGASRSGLPGLASGCLSPEQVAGGETEPPGDIYALGSLLAYAATGHTVPEQGEVPQSLRRTIASCLAREAAARPRAEWVLAELTDEEQPAGAQPPNGAATRAWGLLGPGWLPPRVIEALVGQSAGLLAAETATPPAYAAVTDASGEGTQAPWPYPPTALDAPSPAPGPRAS